MDVQAVGVAPVKNANVSAGVRGKEGKLQVGTTSPVYTHITGVNTAEYMRGSSRVGVHGREEGGHTRPH